MYKTHSSYQRNDSHTCSLLKKKFINVVEGKNSCILVCHGHVYFCSMIFSIVSHMLLVMWVKLGCWANSVRNVTFSAQSGTSVVFWQR